MALKYIGERDRMYLYPWYFSDLVATNEINSIAGGNTISEIFIYIKEDHLSFYYEGDSLDLVGKYLFERVRDDREFFEEVENKIKIYSEDLIEFCRHIGNTEELKKMSESDLLEIYQDYEEKLRVLRLWGWVPVFIDGIDKNFLSDELFHIFSDHMSSMGKSKDIAEAYALLSGSDQMSEVQKEELSRLNILTQLQKRDDYDHIAALIDRKEISAIEERYSDVSELLMAHRDTYGYLTYAYSGPEMSLEDLVDLLQENVASGSIDEQKTKITSHYEKLRILKERLFKNLQISRELRYLFEISAAFMFIKDYRKGIYQQSYVVMDRVLREIAERMNISLREVKYLTREEVSSHFKNAHSSASAIAKERSKESSYLVKNGKLTFLNSIECEKILKKLSVTIDTDQKSTEKNELHGMVAYQGKVSGSAKVVLVKEDVKKMEKGDILISSSTNPDLLLAMKKAAAIVTDFGGITSHAAIVSREMQIPCVLGTKEATKVISDGDHVTVDAQLGIITIKKN